MKNLYEAATVEEVKERIARLGPSSARQWGKMNVAQAVAHCSGPMEWAVGDSFPPRMFLGRIFGPIVKSKVPRDEKPMARNTPTAKSLVVADERDFETERERLCILIDRFAGAGPTGCTTHPHTFLGRLTPEEWATLMYKHLDHHLRQFWGLVPSGQMLINPLTTSNLGMRLLAITPAQFPTNNLGPTLNSERSLHPCWSDQPELWHDEIITELMLQVD